MDLNVGQLHTNNISMKATQAVDMSAAPSSVAPVQAQYQNSPQQTQLQNVTQDYQVRTRLTTREELTEYATVASLLGKEEKKYFNMLLATGRLLDSKSNDKSSTLDNLYKIATTERATGLDSANVLNQTVTTLADPFTITQKFGDIPTGLSKSIVAEGLKGKALGQNKSLEQVVKEQVEAMKAGKNKQRSLEPLSQGHSPDIITSDTINVEHSGCCVAASIEFSFAQKYPAEFARFVAGLTSPSVSVSKNISTKNLNENSLDSVWLLNAFKIPYKMKDFDNASVVLAPDKNAILRAQVQNSYRDKGERSIVDVLMQSTFMNVGSQQTYDSLTDMNSSELNTNDSGLGEFEKTFVESVVEDKNTTSLTFQNLNDDGVLQGYAFPPEKMFKYLVDSLKSGNSVIVGLSMFDQNNKMINGHEVTLIGLTQDKKGNFNFIYNDTDDDISEPISVPVMQLLPSIHHAGLPAEVLKDEPKDEATWVDGLKQFKQEVNNQKKSQTSTTTVQQSQSVVTQPQIVPPVIVYNGAPYSYAPNMYQKTEVQQAIYNQAQQKA